MTTPAKAYGVVQHFYDFDSGDADHRDKVVSMYEDAETAYRAAYSKNLERIGHHYKYEQSEEVRKTREWVTEAARLIHNAKNQTWREKYDDLESLAIVNCKLEGQQLWQRSGFNTCWYRVDECAAVVKEDGFCKQVLDDAWLNHCFDYSKDSEYENHVSDDEKSGVTPTAVTKAKVYGVFQHMYDAESGEREDVDRLLALYDNEEAAYKVAYFTNVEFLAKIYDTEDVQEVLETRKLVSGRIKAIHLKKERSWRNKYYDLDTLAYRECHMDGQQLWQGSGFDAYWCRVDQCQPVVNEDSRSKKVLDDNWLNRCFSFDENSDADEPDAQQESEAEEESDSPSTQRPSKQQKIGSTSSDNAQKPTAPVISHDTKVKLDPKGTWCVMQYDHSKALDGEHEDELSILAVYKNYETAFRVAFCENVESIANTYNEDCNNELLKKAAPVIKDIKNVYEYGSTWRDKCSELESVATSHMGLCNNRLWYDSGMSTSWYDVELCPDANDEDEYTLKEVNKAWLDQVLDIPSGLSDEEDDSSDEESDEPASKKQRLDPATKDKASAWLPASISNKKEGKCFGFTSSEIPVYRPHEFHFLCHCNPTHDDKTIRGYVQCEKTTTIGRMSILLKVKDVKVYVLKTMPDCQDPLKLFPGCVSAVKKGFVREYKRCSCKKICNSKKKIEL